MIDAQTKQRLKELVANDASKGDTHAVIKLILREEDELTRAAFDQPFHNEDKVDEISEKVLGHRFFRRYRSRVKHFTVVSVHAIAGVTYAVALNDSAYGWQNGYYRSCLVRADRLLNSKSYLDVTNAS